MSFSFRLPEENPVCECRYDEIHDRMDREGCPFHCDTAEDTETAGLSHGDRKPPASLAPEIRRQKIASRSC